jgi:hypothetical protein
LLSAHRLQWRVAGLLEDDRAGHFRRGRGPHPHAAVRSRNCDHDHALMYATEARTRARAACAHRAAMRPEQLPQVGGGRSVKAR